MPETQLVKTNGAEAIEQALIGGNLAGLNTENRLAYYKQVCESLGLNPLTKPFEYITLNGKLVLYAKKDATEQLRRVHGIAITKLEKEIQDGIFIVTAHAADKSGRTYIATGAVPIENIKGENRAIAIMKAETKAKRRVTLSLAGLGMLDESELDSIATDLPIPAIVQSQPETPALPAPSGEELAKPVEPVQNLDNSIPAEVVDTPVDEPESDSPSKYLPKANLAPAPANDAAKPTPEQFASFKSKASNLRVELEKHGFKGSATLPAGRKLVQYFLIATGAKALEDLTLTQWNTTFSVIENLLKSDPKQAVKVINEKVEF